MKLNIKNSLILLKLDNTYNLNNINKLTLEELRKTYHIMALNYHPDKNLHENANHQFQEINSAYKFLETYIKNIETTYTDSNDNNYNNYNDDNKEYVYDRSSYINLINSFLDLILKNINTNKCDNIDISSFHNQCINCSIEIFEKLITNLNINVLQDIYSYINNYSNDSKYEIIIDKLKNIMKKKLANYNIYIINPNINNLINSDIYKLVIEENIVCIPLWHNELNYENNIIKIEPILDKTIKVDKCNTIHYYYKNNFENITKMVRNNEVIKINIVNIKLEIDPCNLKFINNQYFTFHNIGIPLINFDNIFDNIKKGGIIVEVILE